MSFAEKATILDAKAMRRAIRRVAHEIVEVNKGTESIVVVGIQRRGVSLARAIVDSIREAEGVEVSFGTLDITFYRDDLSTLGPVPKVGKTDLSFDVNDKHIVLVDDVLFTGRTIRAAMDALLAHGRPSTIELAVLVDRRFRRELPIEPKYVGRSVDSLDSQRVKVIWAQHDGEGEDRVELINPTAHHG